MRLLRYCSYDNFFLDSNEEMHLNFTHNMFLWNILHAVEGSELNWIHDYEKEMSHHFVILFLLHRYVPSDIGYHVCKKQNQVPSTNSKINVKNIVVKMKGTKHSTWASFWFHIP